MNAEDIIRQILKTLTQAEGHPLAGDVLRMHVDCAIRPRPMKAVVDECLRSMQERGLILSQANELDMTETNPLWMLDEKGQAMAARLRL